MRGRSDKPVIRMKFHVLAVREDDNGKKRRSCADARGTKIRPSWVVAYLGDSTIRRSFQSISQPAAWGG